MRPAASLPLVTVVLLCLLTIAAGLDHNHRGADGQLGRTTPAWQEPIIAGTAPAPYVYRQGVPRMRQALAPLLLPGHAAVAVDLAFAIVALASALVIARRAESVVDPALALVAATLAIAGSLPSDKPEAVAVIALQLAIAALLLRDATWPAAVVASLAAFVRPEIPIVFAVALLLASRRAQVTRPAVWRASAAVSFVAGAAWLAYAKLVLWPDAVYPEGTRALTLVENFGTPLRWPGLAACALLAVALSRWGSRVEPAPRVAIAAMQIGLLLACATLGRSDEIRLLMPTFVVAICVGALALSRPG